MNLKYSIALEDVDVFSRHLLDHSPATHTFIDLAAQQA